MDGTASPETRDAAGAVAAPDDRDELHEKLCHQVDLWRWAIDMRAALGAQSAELDLALQAAKASEQAANASSDAKASSDLIAQRSLRSKLRSFAS